MIRIQVARIALAAALLAAATAQAAVELDFIPFSPAHGHAARSYKAIWGDYGERIVAALETRTCLPFVESHVAAVVADAVSNSGGPNFPMRLRATYDRDLKQSTLVHELGHRLLWQLVERLDGVDGHKTLFLVLDRVWADVWGEKFAEDRVAGESAWQGDYDYAAAWAWARSLTSAERALLWNRLLVVNGFPGHCNGSMASAEYRASEKTSGGALRR
jgi:hypothetical protein